MDDLLLSYIFTGISWWCFNVAIAHQNGFINFMDAFREGHHHVWAYIFAGFVLAVVCWPVLLLFAIITKLFHLKVRIGR